MIKRFIVIVAVFSTVLATAQENASSPYSYYGIGLTQFKGTVENRSMGGINVFSDSIHLNLGNPASLGQLQLTNYSIGGSHERLGLESASEEDDARNTTLDYLAVGIPVGRFAFAFGVMPYTSVGYRILHSQDEVASRLNGRGGMNKVFLAAGFQVSNSLSLGVDGNYNFGNFQHRRTMIRQGIQFGTRDISRTDIKGFNFKFGADFQKMVTGDLKLHASATYAPEANLTTENYRELATIVLLQGRETVVDERTEQFADSEFALPAEWSVGAGLGKPNNWFFGGEYTNLGSSSYLNSFNTQNQDVIYQDASQYKVGGYIIPQYNSLTSYIKRIVYRAGFRYEETGLNLSGQSIDEFGISFGVGLPVGPNFSNTNIGIEYGQRGTTDSDLIKEEFFKISIGLSLNDKWFQRRRFN